ncbi:ParB/RepB/Spo0J family partition protein [Candidatus Microgenomates bacterium]|nr:ParB/RepB/Spo0J family partition protein [Candidatus Microgenomates bacterium]
MADQIVQISVEELQTNPLQPRGVITPESLVDLIDSIREHGVLEPLVVAKTPAGYQIIAGERRWRAARLAGLAEVPSVIRETTPQGMLEMALVENVQRVDLNPIDRAKGFKRLIDEFNLHTTQIAQRVGKSTAYVSNSLRLLTLPDALKDGLLQGLITEGHARALAAIEETGLMIEAYKIVLREAASVRRAEDLARRMKTKVGLSPSVASTPIVSDEIDKMEKDFEEALGGKQAASVKLRRSRIQTRLLFILRGDLEQTNGILEKISAAVASATNGKAEKKESKKENEAAVATAA